MTITMSVGKAVLFLFLMISYGDFDYNESEMKIIKETFIPYYEYMYDAVITKNDYEELLKDFEVIMNAKKMLEKEENEIYPNKKRIKYYKNLIENYSQKNYEISKKAINVLKENKSIIKTIFKDFIKLILADEKVLKEEKKIVEGFAYYAEMYDYSSHLDDYIKQ